VFSGYGKRGEYLRGEGEKEAAGTHRKRKHRGETRGSSNPTCRTDISVSTNEGGRKTRLAVLRKDVLGREEGLLWIK